MSVSYSVDYLIFFVLEPQEGESLSLIESMQEKVDSNISALGLRNFFVGQLATAIRNKIDPSKVEAKKVWDQLSFEMSCDYIKENKREEVAIGRTYSFVDNELFEKSGKHISHFPGLYSDYLFDAIGEEIQSEISKLGEDADKPYYKLNEDQSDAYDKLMEAIDTKAVKPKCFFLSGSVGTGKTFVYKALVYKLLSQHKKVLCCTPTEIAATLLPYGLTCHKTFDLPIEYSKYPRADRQSSHYGTQHAKVLKEASSS
jgi:primosomal protein N'